MLALPILKHLNVFEDVLCRVFMGRVVPMAHALSLGCLREAFDTDLVPLVAFTAHDHGDTLLAEQIQATCSANSMVNREPITQLITRHEYRSRTTAK